jgi:hypothetical protein
MIWYPDFILRLPKNIHYLFYFLFILAWFILSNSTDGQSALRNTLLYSRLFSYSAVYSKSTPHVSREQSRPKNLQPHHIVSRLRAIKHLPAELPHLLDHQVLSFIPATKHHQVRVRVLL